MKFVRMWLLFVAISSFLALAQAMVHGHLAPVSAWISLAVGLLLSGVISYSKPTKIPLDAALWERVIWGFVLVTVLFHSIFLVYEAEHVIWTLHKNNLGDLGLHVGMIRYLADASFPPQNPIFFSDDLDYPFGINLFSAIFEKLGVATFLHMRWVLLFSSVALLFVLYSLGGTFLVLFFFFSASSYSYFAGSEIALKNFFLSLWITQRGLLFALPAGLLLIQRLQLWVRFQRPLPFAEGLLFAAMPFFHLHSFFALFLLFCTTLLVYRLSGGWRMLGVGVCALPFLWNSTDGFSKASLVHFKFGWEIANSLEFVRNFGPWFVVFAGLSIWLTVRRHLLGLYALVLVAYLVLFLNLMVAPWSWDNIKVLIWPYFGLAYLFAEQVKKVQVVATLLLLPAFLPGVLEVYRSWPIHGHSVALLDRSEINDWEQVLGDFGKDKAVAIYPTYNHPVSWLGYPVVMGYAGHLWSHGIDYSESERSLKDFYQGRSKALAGEVSLFAFGQREVKGFAVDRFPASSRSQVSSGEVILYEPVDTR